jgi:hypothetical protein
MTTGASNDTKQRPSRPAKEQGGPSRVQNVIRMSSHTTDRPPPAALNDHHRGRRRFTAARSSPRASFNTGLAQVRHMSVLRLVHDDLGSGVLEQAQPAGVIGVQVAQHDVAEVIRPQPGLLEPGEQADPGGDLVEVDEVLPRCEPIGFVPVRVKSWPPRTSELAPVFCSTATMSNSFVGTRYGSTGWYGSCGSATCTLPDRLTVPAADT